MSDKQQDNTLTISSIAGLNHAVSEQNLKVVTADAITLLSLQSSAMLGVLTCALESESKPVEHDIVAVLDIVVDKLDKINRSALNIKPSQTVA